MIERQYLVALSSFPLFGPIRIKLLIDYFGSAKKVWESDTNSLRETNLGIKMVDAFINYRKNFDTENYFKNLDKYSVKFAVINDPDYPINLKEIDSAPPVLYFKGFLKKEADINSVAIVGTRKVSEYGKKAAYDISFELSRSGLTIISGLALGVDAISHQACIDAGGRGIVVLASGLDTISPVTNKWIAEKIVEKGGAIVSEYPVGTPAYKTSFPVRNRIVSGLSKGVVVVQGLIKSGTMHTVKSAAEQGRTVFAIPGSIFSPLSEAPHFLIQSGAKLVTSAHDVIEELYVDANN